MRRFTSIPSSNSVTNTSTSLTCVTSGKNGSIAVTRTLDKDRSLCLPLDQKCLDFYIAQHQKVRERLCQVMESEGLKRSEYMKIVEELNTTLNRFGDQVESAIPIKLVNKQLDLPPVIKAAEQLLSEEIQEKSKNKGRTYWQRMANKIDNYTSRSISNDVSIDVFGALGETKPQPVRQIQKPKFIKKADAVSFVRSQLNDILDKKLKTKPRNKNFTSFHISSLEYPGSNKFIPVPSSRQSVIDLSETKKDPASGLVTGNLTSCTRTPNQTPLHRSVKGMMTIKALHRVTMRETLAPPLSKTKCSPARHLDPSF